MDSTDLKYNNTFISTDKNEQGEFDINAISNRFGQDNDENHQESLLDNDTFMKNKLYNPKKETDNNDNETMYNQQPLRNIKYKTTLNIDEKSQKPHIKHKVTRYLIDSKQRKMIPKNDISSYITLSTNSFEFTKDSRFLKITKTGHGLGKDDIITIRNVNNNKIINNPIEIYANDDYVKIKHTNHGLNIDSDKYNDLYVTLNNVLGNRVNYNYINELPVTLFNTTHKIYLRKSVHDNLDPDYYYIKITQTPINTYIQSDQEENNYVTIKQLNLAGIPLNIINADYPLSTSQQKGNHIVYDVEDDYFTIELDMKASESVITGNKNIRIGIVDRETPGYPDANNYEFEFARTFNNVVKIDIVSLLFTNSEKIIKDFPDSEQNNKLYWQNLEDGDNIYSLEIDAGDYTDEKLANVIKEKWEATPRVNFESLFEYSSTDPNKRIYPINYSKVDVVINRDTDIAKFTAYNQVYIPLCITKQSNTYDDGYNRIIINHKSHSLQVGDKITISNAISTEGIPANKLNKEFVIEKIINENRYELKLDLYNEEESVTNNNGGNEILITYPLKIKMFFDRTDTMGKILGFRNTGNSLSVTQFSNEITNKMPYENDFIYNTVGKTEAPSGEVRHGTFNDNGHRYVAMTCNLFESNLKVGHIKNLFAIILNNGLPGQRIYEFYKTLQNTFNRPISTLSSIQFSFYTPDNNLYNFNGEEHVLVLEIYEQLQDNNNLEH